MGARNWSKSFISPSPSPPSSTMSRDNPDSDDNDDATSALPRSSNLNRRLDLSTREDTAVVPDANPFSLSKKRSAAQKGKGKTSSVGSTIRPAGNVRPASARKAQASVPEDTFERKKGWSNGHGESIPPVTKSKRKADDGGSCKQIGGNRLPRDANLSLRNSSTVKKTSSTSTSKKKAPKKKADDDISFHRLPRDSDESRNFPIIAGLARQRSLPTKAEKPEPDINLIVSGHGARVIRTTRKTGRSQPQDESSRSSRSSVSSVPSLQKWLAPDAPPQPSSSAAEQRHTASSPPSVEEDDVPQAGIEAPQAPKTPPPSLVQPGASGYASSAVTTLKTPSTVRRVEREPTPEKRPEHIQLLEDMAEQLPQGYSLHEQADCRPELNRNHSTGQAYADPVESPSPVTFGTPTQIPTSKRLSPFRFNGSSAATETPSYSQLSENLSNHSTSHPTANLNDTAGTGYQPQPHPATARVPLPPAFNSPGEPPQIRPLPFRSVARPSFTSIPLPHVLTPKFSSPAQVIRPRSQQRQPPQPPRVAPPYTQPQPRSQPHQSVRTTGSYVGLYQPKPTYPANSGKRRLTLAPGRTSYTGGAKVTTWEPTPLSQSRVTAPAPVQQNTYVPRHLRALQQAAEPMPPPRPAPVEEDEDWDADWRRQ